MNALVYVTQKKGAFQDYAPTVRKTEGFRPEEKFDGPPEVVGRDAKSWFKEMHSQKLQQISPSAKMKRKQKSTGGVNHLVSLEEFDPERSRKITSPTSIEACLRLGIDPVELVKRTPEYFEDAFGYGPEEAEDACERYERKRSQMYSEALSERTKLIEQGWVDYDEQLMVMRPPEQEVELPEKIKERETQQMVKKQERQKMVLKEALKAEYIKQKREEHQQKVEEKLLQRKVEQMEKVLEKHEEEEKKRRKIEEQKKKVEQEEKKKKKKLIKKMKHKDKVVEKIKKKKEVTVAEKAKKNELQLLEKRLIAEALQLKWEQEQLEKFQRKQEVIDQQVAAAKKEREEKYKESAARQTQEFEKVIKRKRTRPVEQHRIEIVQKKQAEAERRRKEKAERERLEREEKKQQRIQKEKERKQKLKRLEKEREKKAKELLQKHETYVNYINKKEEDVRARQEHVRIANIKRKKELQANLVRLERQEEYRRQKLETKLAYDKRRAEMIEEVRAAEISERKKAQQENLIRRAALEKSLEKVKAGQLGDLKDLDIDELNWVV